VVCAAASAVTRANKAAHILNSIYGAPVIYGARVIYGAPVIKESPVIDEGGSTWPRARSRRACRR
jgi:hypothetical protein